MLRQKYFRRYKGKEWEKIKKEAYYNHIVNVQDFLKKYKEQEQKKKNDKLRKDK